MKAAPLLLGVSLAANAALVAVVVRQVPAMHLSASESASDNSSAHAKAGPKEGPAADRKAAADTPRAAAGAIISWQALSRSELPELVGRLRAAGFPNAAIRAILYARLKDQFEGRIHELMAGVEEVPYWQVKRSSYYNPKVMAAQREVRQEQLRLLKDLLGDEAVEDNEISRYYRQRQFGDIAPDKAEEMQRILSDYNELRSEIYARANGAVLPEDRAQIGFLEKALREDAAKVLSPAELENFELRSSNTANSLRSQLTTFQPTEDEFRALFRAAQAVEDKFGTSVGLQSREQMQQRVTAMNELAQQALTPERFAAFTQATDPRNAQLNRIVARYELPTSVVPQVNAVQQDIQKRLGELRTAAPADRAAVVTALVQEAETRIAPLLGTNGFEAYKIYGGQWMQSLQQMAQRIPQTPINVRAPTPAAPPGSTTKG